MAGWNTATAAGGGPGAVTVIDGSTFCVSGTTGDMAPDFSHGWFYRDIRVLTRWNLRVGGARLEPLGAYSPRPDEARFIGRVPHRADHESTLVVERRRTVEPQLTEVVSVSNYGTKPERLTLVLRVESDFADLFDVKAGREDMPSVVTREDQADSITLKCTRQGVTHRVRVTCPGATARQEGLTITITVPVKGTVSATFAALPSRSAPDPETGGMSDRIEQALRADRKEWFGRLPAVKIEDEDLERTLRRSVADLGTLRIEDPIRPGNITVAAGAPWFMTLFGRDSLLTSYLSLPIDRTLALGTLQTLAAHQGSRLVLATDEEPGRILHEVRRGHSATKALQGSNIYYGTADATPLFVMLLGELHRWGGLPQDTLEQLLPHADRALSWVKNAGDRDRDGFVEYARHSEHGLLNQGWKDSWDGINFADGTIARGPIALAEVQGYVYRAWRDRAELALAVGDEPGASQCRERAEALKVAFNERFWLPDKGWLAVALDGEKKPVDALTSNIGHCLWTGIIDDEHVESVVGHLMSPRMFSGWGIRTLADDMGAYNPVSYHNGSVWPHDNAIIADGLRRCGFLDEARQVAFALLQAAAHFDGRLPELFCGFARDEHPEPIAYPTSCSPQAWAAAAPIHLVRVLLGFDPDVPGRGYRLAPNLPQEFGSCRVEHLPLGGGVLTFSAHGRDVLIEQAPSSLKRIAVSGPGH